MYKDHREPFRPPEAEDIFNLVTKETPKTFFVGKLLEATVTGFAYKPPQNEELDKAAPQRKGEENMWQCPFCGQDDFPELTEVSPLSRQNLGSSYTRQKPNLRRQFHHPLRI